MAYYKFLADPVKDSELVTAIKKSIIEGKICKSKLDDQDIEYPVIESNTPILLQLDKADDGQEILSLTENKPDLENIFTFEKLGKNISNRMGGETFFAAREGIFFVDDGLPQVLELEKDGQFELLVSPDNVKLFVNIFPPLEGGTPVELDDIMHRANRKKIKSPINSNVIKEVLYKIEVDPQPVYNVNIAAGKAAVDGKDGKIIYYVDTNVDFKPKMTEDGRVDFYHLQILNPVEKDQELILFEEHVVGVDGVDVYGNKIKAKEAKILKFPIGPNTYRDQENPNLLRAAIDGNIIEKKGVLEVTDVFRVDGHVDFSTGNIESKSSVIVTGDVKSSFEMKVDDCIEIGGIVEDATIRASGDVVIKSGFSGTGKGVIYCEGKVDVKYIHEQKIFSRDTINISHEVINSSLFALNRIQVIGGRNMAIYGGYLLAGDSIETSVLGNSYRINTIAEVGFDYRLLEYIDQNNKELTEHKSVLEQVNDGLRQITNFIQLTPDKRKTFDMMLAQKFGIFRNPEQFEDKQVELDKINKIIAIFLSQSRLNKRNADQFNSLVDQKSSLLHLIATKTNDIQEYKNTITKPTKAKIQVNRKIYPGVTLKINGRKFVVEEEMNNKTFYLSKDTDEILFD